MRSYKIFPSADFVKEFKKIPCQVQKKYYKKEKILKENPHNPSLKTHKLGGKLQDNFTFYVDYHYRVIFQVIKNDIILLDIGTHEIYR